MIDKARLPFLRRRAEEAASSLPRLMAASIRAAQAARSGEHSLRRAGGREKFWQFRPYAEGDRPQDIDWRASARGDDVLVRDKERQSVQTNLLWCAGGAGMEYRSQKTLPTKREAALILSLGMALITTQAGDLAGLVDGSVRPGRSDVALEALGRGLLEHSATLPQTFTPAQRTGIILCGDFLDAPEALDFSFAPLAGRTENGLLIQVLDPAEIDLPFSGRVVFQDSFTRARILAPHVETLRAEYKERMATHLRAVEQMCRRFRWHYILHRTDGDIAATLSTAARELGMLR